MSLFYDKNCVSYPSPISTWLHSFSPDRCIYGMTNTKNNIGVWTENKANRFITIIKLLFDYACFLCWCFSIENYISTTAFAIKEEWQMETWWGNCPVLTFIKPDQTRSVWSMDQGTNKNHSSVNNFIPTVTKFCIMWEGQALPHDTKVGNCRDRIMDSRAFLCWSLIHGSSWSGLIKLGPGYVLRN